MKIIPTDQEDDYALFGKIVLLWGQVEMELVNIVLRLFHPLFNPKIKFVFPTSFDTMVKFAIDRYSKIPAMSHVATEAAGVLNSLAPLHKIRTIIVHGQYQGFHWKDVYMFGFYHSRRSEKNRFSIHEISQTELTDTLRKLVHAKSEMEKLSKATFAILPPPAVRSVGKP